MRKYVATTAAAAITALSLALGLALPIASTAAPPSGVNTGPWGIALGDLNKDGQQDIVVATGGGNTIRALLANGSALDSYLPVKTLALNPIVNVGLGDGHTCAAFNNSSVRCWGLGTSGQLGAVDEAGDPLNTNSDAPAIVGGVSGIYKLALGAKHSCAIKLTGPVALDGGTVTCWGDNTFGQLGLGTTSPREKATEVPGISDAIDLSLGQRHTCALLSDRTIKCWGDNTFGQLGDGTRNNSPTPVSVPNLEAVSQVSVGNTHSCALLLGGTVKCWGNGSGGRIGDGVGSRQPVLEPREVVGISSAKKLSVGGSHACAVNGPSNAVFCWGVGTSGQVGDGLTDNHAFPSVVQTIGKVPLTDVTELASGGAHTCAKTSSGDVSCWGSNANGQIGDGQPTLKTRPLAVAVPKLKGTTSLSAGAAHTCAIDATKTLLCSGANLYGQLGNGFGFVPQPPLAAGSSPASIAAADVNDDGNIDIIAPNAGHDMMQKFYGDGTGKLAKSTELEINGDLPNSLAGPTPTDVALVDVDRDKTLDAITANVGTRNLAVALNDGDGGFEQVTPNPPTGRLPNGLIGADFNNDKLIDFASTTYGNGSAMVQIQQPLTKKDRNDGKTFKFGNFFQFTIGAGPVGVAPGDFDGDKITDFATACQYDGTVEMILSRPTKKKAYNFKRVLIKTGTVPQSIASGDVTGDKKPDVVISDTAHDLVVIVPTLGKGKFGKPIRIKLPTGSAPVTVAVGDVSGDRLADVIVILGEEEAVGVLLSRGGGAFKFSRSESMTNKAPLIVNDPAISGLPELDATLIASPGEWDVNGDTFIDEIPLVPRYLISPPEDPGNLSDADKELVDPYTFQWRRSTNQTRWVDIPDATTSSYIATSDDINRYLQVCVTALYGSVTSAQACTAPTEVITDPNEDAGGEGVKNRRWKKH